MNTLERHGLLSLLRQTVPHLRDTLGYGQRIGNGSNCWECRDGTGFGVVRDHKPDCAGVRLLRDIEAVLAEVGDGA